ncbi:hypothetical protein SAY87_025819 [Trapa incisa]|uniref:RING-type E3 ubiquitin transferase n=1 Tax=Trapa incisa TaxID=236973 RepID=A0AAN7JJT7_9MYRT|nr:hypothetical protein SAY87_025819 [Trapa incisa]
MNSDMAIRQPYQVYHRQEGDRVSSLRGSRSGLECSVCLSKFEDVEILQLLPKCKHAFHIGCTDHWLERHSTCPLCRCRISPNDPSIFAYSNSMRLLTFSNRHSQRIDIEDPNSFRIFIEPEDDNDDDYEMSSSNMGIGSSSRVPITTATAMAARMRRAF